MDTFKIVNSSKRVNFGVSKYEFLVPTGKCETYRNRMRDDWFLRINSEVNRYNKSDGKVVFVTLTYDDLYLPWFHYNFDGIKGSFKCFNKKHITTFINSIRKYFERKNISSTLGFKYMCCCEYGMDPDHTHRPHYHVLLFFPKEFVSCLSDNGFYTSFGFQKFINKYWKYGFTYFSKESKGGTFVVGEKPAFYVSKYCCKDLGFFKQPEVSNFLYDSKGRYIKPRYDLCKEYLPHHWQSKGFGEDLVNTYNNVDSLLHGHNFNLVSDISAGKAKFHQAPRYILRKLCYDQQKDGTYVLNSYGEKFFSAKFDLILQNQTKFYENFFSNNLGIDWSQYVTDGLLNKCGCYDYSVNRWNTVRSLITGILENRKFEELVCYKNAWSGVPVDLTTIKLFGNLDSLNLSDFIKSSRKLYLLQHSSNTRLCSYHPYGYYNNLPECQKSDIEANLAVNIFQRFHGFDKVLDIINAMMNERARLINEKSLQDREKLKQVKLQIA